MGTVTTIEALDLFRSAMAEKGLVVPDNLVPDGNIHRCGTEGDPRGQDGAYLMHLDDMPVLWCRNWKTDEGCTLAARSRDDMTPAERAALQKRWDDVRAQARQEETARHEEAARRAVELFDKCMPAQQEHPYLQQKKVLATDMVKQTADGRLVIPLFDQEGTITSLQFIAAAADSQGKWQKRFLAGGKTKGCWFFLPQYPKQPRHVILICEGYATGVSLFAATGYEVRIAFNAGNLLPVAQAARKGQPATPIVLCADNDTKPGTDANIGIEKAREAAQAVQAILAVPPLCNGEATDFNDLERASGSEAVRAVIEKALESTPYQGKPQAAATPEQNLSEEDRAILQGVEKKRAALKGTAEKESLPPLRCVDALTFINMELPGRTFLLEPLIATQSLSMVFAARGIGKTFFALTIAAGIATGSRVFGRWTPPKPATVLYVDGEMPAVSLQERVHNILQGMDSRDYAANLRFITPDLQEKPMPNLATREGQEALDPFLDGVDLLVMDNIATLARTGKANDEDSWLPVQEWLLQLRRRGLSVLLVHHAGKNGSQRGTGAKEDILDNVLEMKRSSFYQMDQGCCFEVHFTKARGLAGKDTQPFEATYSVDATGQACWQTRSVDDVLEKKVKDLLELDMSEDAIAAELGVNRSTVTRAKRRLRDKGEIAQAQKLGRKKSRI